MSLVKRSGTGSGMAIGNTVTSGDPYRVLFLDSLGKLAQSSSFSFQSNQLLLDNAVVLGTASITIDTNALAQGIHVDSHATHTGIFSDNNWLGKAGWFRGSKVSNYDAQLGLFDRSATFFNSANSNAVNLSTASYCIDAVGPANINGSITTTSFIKSGGTSDQFLKADGSVSSGSPDLVTYTYYGGF